VFTKNRGHRIITFEQAHDQAQEHRRLPTRPAAEDPGGRPGQPVSKRAG
jgi:hypothetical protein